MGCVDAGLGLTCAVCGARLETCRCPDLDARLKAGRALCAMKWCTTCDRHYRRCQCVVPRFTLMFGDEDLGLGPHRTAGGMLVISRTER